MASGSEPSLLRWAGHMEEDIVFTSTDDVKRAFAAAEARTSIKLRIRRDQDRRNAKCYDKDCKGGIWCRPVEPGKDNWKVQRVVEHSPEKQCRGIQSKTPQTSTPSADVKAVRAKKGERGVSEQELYEVLADKNVLTKERPGLAEMFHLVTGREMEKDEKTRVGGWNQKKLTKKQITYAVNDVLAGLDIAGAKDHVDLAEDVGKEDQTSDSRQGHGTHPGGHCDLSLWRSAATEVLRVTDTPKAFKSAMQAAYLMYMQGSDSKVGTEVDEKNATSNLGSERDEEGLAQFLSDFDEEEQDDCYKHKVLGDLMSSM